jgi:hypothetical protein
MLQQIGEYTSNSAAAGGFDRPDAHITRTPLRLDERAWTQLAEATKKWLREVQRIEDGAKKRIDRQADPHEAVDVGLVIMLFEAQPFTAQQREKEGARPARRVGAPTRRGRAAFAQND